MGLTNTVIWFGDS